MITLILGILGGMFALFGLKKAGQGVVSAFKTEPKVKIAEAIVENHAVASQVEAAKTDEEADHALKADALSDRS